MALLRLPKSAFVWNAPRDSKTREVEKMKIFAYKPFRYLALAATLGLPVATHAVTFFNPTLGAPAKLSDVNIYQNMTTKVTDTALKYFEVNSALWSDAAHKDRWIILPPGTQVTYVDSTDKFEYPDNTIFVKLFRHDTVMGDTFSRVYWETRLLVKKAGNNNNWYGFSYKWNKAGNEAFLVDVNAGLDTLIYLNSAPYYRKWHYPTQAECNQCHRVSDGGRAVLGFFPAQLKRPAYKLSPAKDQVTALFDNGVFTGTRPTSAQLGKRWRGMGEAIPTNLSAAERFKVIDTMARAYIAANCSGCHGDRGLAEGATGHAPELNYDFYNFKPRMEFGFKPTATFGLELSDAELYIGDTTVRPANRYQFLLTLKQWGINTGSQSNFDMVRPPASGFPAGVEKSPSLVVQGFPGYSTILFRQAARKDPMFDSIDTFLELGPTGSGDPQQRKKWLFKAKWGSKAWRDSLAAHSVAMNQIFTRPRFEADGGQMPPLATYIPDTAALKILGEWARNYITLVPVPGENPVVSVKSRVAQQGGMPSIYNRQLVVPEGWTGKAVMISLDGRSIPLASAGRGRYALPASMPSGVYFFQVGSRSFRASVMK
jgi:hypothetical protein